MNQLYNLTPGQIYGINPLNGDIGLEIECEGKFLHQGNLALWWNGHIDNSLRPVGEHQPQEYTLKSPISRKDIPEALDYLIDVLTEKKAQPVFGQRTSLHVHLNVSKMMMRDIVTLCTMYYIFEDVLTEYAGGRNRVGSLFCLRAVDAEAVIRNFCRSIVDEDYNMISSQDRMKYAALNLSTMRKFGSLEFRAHEGTLDKTRILRWVDMILGLKKASSEYDNPQLVIQDFSGLGPDGYLRKVFGESSAFLRNIPGYRERIWEGMRIAQDLAYCIPEWIVEKPSKSEKSPPKKRPMAAMFTNHPEVEPSTGLTGSGPIDYYVPAWTMVNATNIYETTPQAEIYNPGGFALSQADINTIRDLNLSYSTEATAIAVFNGQFNSNGRTYLWSAEGWYRAT